MIPGSDPYGIIDDGALAVRDGAIAWLGKRSALPAAPATLAHEVVDANGYCITPGLVDPHTHLVYAGNRLGDFERRIGGAAYAANAASGSGIGFTVAKTRSADEETLFSGAMKRLATLVRGGVTTVEVKSGYGLDVETEFRLLRTARRLQEAAGISVRSTFLGAHVVPAEYATDREAYVSLLCGTMIPRIAADGLADAVDAFCESGAFSVAETEQVLTAAQRHGLPVKLHADQLSDGGGAELAARFRAQSADHLEFTSEAGIAALAAAGTVAVVLPGAYYFLHETQRPPIAALRRHRVPIALATDSNPGTSPVTSLPIIMNLACVLFGLTPHEALLAVTRNAALALGLHDRGELRLGARCDLALWDVASPAELVYWLGADLCRGVVVAGTPRSNV